MAPPKGIVKMLMKRKATPKVISATVSPFRPELKPNIIQQESITPQHGEMNVEVPFPRSQEMNVEVPIPMTQEMNVEVPIPMTQEENVEVPIPMTQEEIVEVPTP